MHKRQRDHICHKRVCCVEVSACQSESCHQSRRCYYNVSGREYRYRLWHAQNQHTRCRLTVAIQCNERRNGFLLHAESVRLSRFSVVCLQRAKKLRRCNGTERSVLRSTCTNDGQTSNDDQSSDAETDSSTDASCGENAS